jgi:hypothetical protein
MSNAILSAPDCLLQDTALEYARLRFRSRPAWLEYTREVKEHCVALMGVEAAERFFRQPEFREVHGMMVQLALHGSNVQARRMITVRLPRELHDALKNEAGGLSTSLNRLCIAKLLQSIGRLPAGVVLGAGIPQEI